MINTSAGVPGQRLVAVIPPNRLSVNRRYATVRLLVCLVRNTLADLCNTIASTSYVRRAFSADQRVCTAHHPRETRTATALSLHFWLALQMRPVSFRPLSGPGALFRLVTQSTEPARQRACAGVRPCLPPAKPRIHFCVGITCGLQFWASGRH